MQKCVINSAIVLIILSKYTTFFGSNHNFTQTQDLSQNQDVLFIGSMFLKIRKSATISTHLVRRSFSKFTISYQILILFNNKTILLLFRLKNELPIVSIPMIWTSINKMIVLPKELA